MAVYANLLSIHDLGTEKLKPKWEHVYMLFIEFSLASHIFTSGIFTFDKLTSDTPTPIPCPTNKRKPGKPKYIH